MDHEYLIEKRLRALDPQLHSRYKNCVVVSSQMLQQYRSTFPEYTDHSTLHTLEIVDSCNLLIGDQIDRLSADDLYVLLMGALFHDVGMGISEKDFYSFYDERDPAGAGPFEREDLQDQIRKNHHELSGWFVRKYWQIFDIPSAPYAEAIIQVCRGHRKTDLLDPEEFPETFFVADGRGVTLPYLAALIRLADELDIAADRNSTLLYDPMRIRNDISRLEFLKHQSIRSAEILPDCVLVKALSDDPKVCEGIVETVSKVAEVLRYCREAVARRTSFIIRQQGITLDLNGRLTLL
ncbi:MAG: hypothetical protein IKU58_07995 [Clostridia bacterium]|nr:hypothetical protein [Clostridia bacterium]